MRPPGSRPTRRETIALGAAAGAGVFATAGRAAGADDRLPPGVSPANRFARADGDKEIVAGLLGFEQRSAFAYARLAAHPKVGRAMRRELERFAGQQRSHAATLAKALDELGEDPPPAPTRPDQVRGLLRALSGGERAALRFAGGVAGTGVRLYFDAVAVLASSTLRSTAGRIMANEAQQQLALRQALGGGLPARAFVPANPIG